MNTLLHIFSYKVNGSIKFFSFITKSNVYFMVFSYRIGKDRNEAKHKIISLLKFLCIRYWDKPVIPSFEVELICSENTWKDLHITFNWAF
jgi:hypothetical protein